MINELLFASNNANKVAELKAACPANFSIISLQDAGIDIAIEEPYLTLEENAKEKCRVFYQLTGKNCFAEDSGLFVEALNGEPGVHSARYAGEAKNEKENINKLLKNLSSFKNRSAYFKTTICLYYNNTYYYFLGKCNGKIETEPKGTNGFGYDSVFIPNGYKNTFGELDNALKVNISHRKKAFEKLFIFLSTNLIN